jgi:hypothetical protein
MSTTPAINEKNFKIGRFFYMLLRFCWVADYTHIMLFYLILTLRCAVGKLILLQGYRRYINRQCHGIDENPEQRCQRHWQETQRCEYSP